MRIYHFYESLHGIHTFNDEAQALAAWQRYKDIPGSFYWMVEAVSGYWNR